MIDLSRFPEDIASRFAVGGYPDETLEEDMAFVPDWVPKDYWEFFRHYKGFSKYSVELLTPGPGWTYENLLKAQYEAFQQRGYPNSGGFFPIAYIDVDAWGVFHREEDGSVQCGEYDFADGEFYRGPYPSFEDWLYSFVNYLD